MMAKAIWRRTATICMGVVMLASMSGCAQMPWNQPAKEPTEMVTADALRQTLSQQAVSGGGAIARVEMVGHRLGFVTIRKKDGSFVQTDSKGENAQEVGLITNGMPADQLPLDQLLAFHKRTVDECNQTPETTTLTVLPSGKVFMTSECGNASASSLHTKDTTRQWLDGKEVSALKSIDSKQSVGQVIAEHRTAMGSTTVTSLVLRYGWGSMETAPRAIITRAEVARHKGFPGPCTPEFVRGQQVGGAEGIKVGCHDDPQPYMEKFDVTKVPVDKLLMVLDKAKQAVAKDGATEDDISTATLYSEGGKLKLALMADGKMTAARFDIDGRQLPTG